MMMIGNRPRSNPTVHIPPWDNYFQDPTSYIQSPANHASQYDVVEAAECDDFDAPVDPYSTDIFRMLEFKVKRCPRARSHDWTECPFAHPGEKARRRDPRKFHYCGSACPDFRKGVCRRGEACEYAHGVFEYWLHPARYRTQLCKDGTHCRRRVCFFAHTAEQFRVLPDTSSSPDESPRGPIHDPFISFGAHYSPPSSPTTASPPVSPGGSQCLNQLADSMRSMQIDQMQMGVGMGMGLSVSPRSWRVRYGSPSKMGPGFKSLPTSPIGSVSRSGLEAWGEEEPVMEVVESGRALREKIYANLVKENSLDRVGRAESPNHVPN